MSFLTSQGDPEMVGLPPRWPGLLVTAKLSLQVICLRLTVLSHGLLWLKRMMRWKKEHLMPQKELKS
jgi:hypothetical protein